MACTSCAHVHRPRVRYHLQDALNRTKIGVMLNAPTFHSQLTPRHSELQYPPRGTTICSSRNGRRLSSPFMDSKSRRPRRISENKAPTALGVRSCTQSSIHLRLSNSHATVRVKSKGLVCRTSGDLVQLSSSLGGRPCRRELKSGSKDSTKNYLFCCEVHSRAIRIINNIWARLL